MLEASRRLKASELGILEILKRDSLLKILQLAPSSGEGVLRGDMICNVSDVLRCVIDRWRLGSEGEAATELRKRMAILDETVLFNSQVLEANVAASMYRKLSSKHDALNVLLFGRSGDALTLTLIVSLLLRWYRNTVSSKMASESETTTEIPNTPIQVSRSKSRSGSKPGIPDAEAFFSSLNSVHNSPILQSKQESRNTMEGFVTGFSPTDSPTDSPTVKAIRNENTNAMSLSLGSPTIRVQPRPPLRDTPGIGGRITLTLTPTLVLIGSPGIGGRMSGFRSGWSPEMSYDPDWSGWMSEDISPHSSSLTGELYSKLGRPVSRLGPQPGDTPTMRGS